MPLKFVNVWSYAVTLLGISYKLLEGSFMLNVSFKFTRKMRNKFDQDITADALLLLFIVFVYIMFGSWFFYLMYQDFSKLSYFIKSMFILQNVASLIILFGTMWYAGNDCTLNNSAFYFLMANFKLYTFYQLSTHMRVSQLTFGTLLWDYFRCNIQFFKQNKI